MTEIELKPVVSSNLKSAGYSEETQELRIEFNGGSIYGYDSVPKELYDKFMEAESKGKFFDAEIKKGNFKYRRIK